MRHLTDCRAILNPIMTTWRQATGIRDWQGHANHFLFWALRLAKFQSEITVCCSGQIPFVGSSSAIKLALHALRSWELHFKSCWVFILIYSSDRLCVCHVAIVGWQHLGRQTWCSNDAINRTDDSDQRNDCIWNGSFCSQPIMQKTDVRHWPTVPWRPFSQFSRIHLNPNSYIYCTFHRWQQNTQWDFRGKKTWRKWSKENESSDFTNAERL